MAPAPRHDAFHISTVLTSILAKRWLREQSANNMVQWNIAPLSCWGTTKQQRDGWRGDANTYARSCSTVWTFMACEGSGGPNQLAAQCSAAQHCDCMQMSVWLGLSGERLVQDPRCHSQQLCRLETQVEAVTLPNKWSAQLAVSVETCGSNCQRHVKVGLGHRILSSRHVSLVPPAHFSTLLHGRQSTETLVRGRRKAYSEGCIPP